MKSNKYNPESIRRAFQFLIDDFGYTILRDEELFHDSRPYAFVIEYIGNERRILLNHEYRDNFFDFKIIRGLDTQYPNDKDFENIIPFLKIFISFNPLLNLRSLQPSDKKTCAEVASMNAQLLKTYAPNILRGDEWC